MKKWILISPDKKYNGSGGMREIHAGRSEDPMFEILSLAAEILNGLPSVSVSIHSISFQSWD